ncbi:MAG: sensor histidine kinase, partial [Alphaproteobacteria bacterium]|nr:sensor histidine kinase [Alphaproteobacteria bacterium]
GLITMRQAISSADLITDHNLLASARVMAQGIHVQEGVLEAIISPSALEMLASLDHDMVYYQVRGPDGTVLAGQPDLKLLKKPTPLEEPSYANGIFRNQKLRLVQISQPVTQPGSTGLATIIVGETLVSRDSLVQSLWLWGFVQQGILVLATAFLAWLGLQRGLLPLKSLQSVMNDRPIGALTSLEAPSAPAEVQPLIASVNDYVARLGLLMETQRRFVANAAHQLRTPLTLLKTQSTYGLREETSAGKQEALSGISTSLDHVARLINQLLVLARAEPGTNHGARMNTDLVPIVSKLMEDFSASALDRSIDLGLELAQEQFVVHGNPTLLRELMANLIDNALVHSGRNSIVTVKLAASKEMVSFIVSDTGPGIAPEERDKVFERFYRLPTSKSEGSGLGLAIVAEIAATHNGIISLQAPQEGHGLIVEVNFPIHQA